MCRSGTIRFRANRRRKRTSSLRLTYTVRRLTLAGPRQDKEAETSAQAKGGQDLSIAVHPGQTLARKLETFGISPTELARQLLVPPNRITQIINGKRGITGDSALRLAHWFGNAPEFWMNLQVQHDLEEAAQELGTQIKALPTCPARRSGRLPKQAQAV